MIQSEKNMNPDHILTPYFYIFNFFYSNNTNKEHLI